MVYVLKQLFGRVKCFKIRACHCLGLVGAGCAVTAWPSHAAHMAASRANNRATALGRSGRLGLVEVGRSEPLAPRSAAQPLAAARGAVAAMLCCRRVRTADTTRVAMLSLPSQRHHVRADPLHICVVASPVRVASAARTWASRRRHAIYGTVAHGPCRSNARTRGP